MEQNYILQRFTLVSKLLFLLFNFYFTICPIERSVNLFSFKVCNKCLSGNDKNVPVLSCYRVS